ncbi:MAG: hypothetical protein ACLU6Y_07585 [Ruminococcus sp.]
MGEIAVITRGGMSMQAVFEAINGVFGFIGPLSDLLWDFPPTLNGIGIFPFWEIYPWQLLYFWDPASFSPLSLDLSR